MIKNNKNPVTTRDKKDITYGVSLGMLMVTW